MADPASTPQADVRTPGTAAVRWAISGDAEALAWAPHAPSTFLASADDGVVAAFDARRGPDAAPLFRLSAHDAPTCAMSFNPAVPGLMATASIDKQVRMRSKMFQLYTAAAACSYVKQQVHTHLILCATVM